MRISLDQVKDYKGKFVYFTLANDKDTARIRILWEGIPDIDIRTIHEVKDSSGNYHKVDCLKQNYDDPDAVCPCCSSSNPYDKKKKVTCMIPVYNIDKKEVQIWTRTGGFVEQALVPKLLKAGEPFCATVFTVERNGAVGDTNTRYELYDEGSDDFRLDDLEEIPNPIGELILEKSFEELQKFMQTRSFDKDAKPAEVTRNRTNADFETGVTRRRGLGSGEVADDTTIPRRGSRPET